MSASARKPPATFEDLKVYQVAREFRKAMYRVAGRLPDVEKFGLASQIRRAAVSLTNNIADGHGRYHYLDQIKFTLQSRGSLEELIDDLNVCGDEEYLGIEETDGYIRYLRQQKGPAGSKAQTSPIYDDAAIDDDSRFSI
jgi:four helix bundle protein